MTMSMLARYERAQYSLLLATLPQSGVMEYDLPDIPLDNLTGPARRADLQRRLADVRGW